MKPRLIGLMIIAALTLTATATANATVFKVSKTGEAKLKGEGLQTLTVAGATGGGQVKCEELSGSAPFNSLELESFVLLVQYSKCEAFGHAATVTVGEILFNANGSIRLPNTDKFVITVPSGPCSVLVQSEGESTIKLYGTIKYTNNANGTVTGTEELTGLSAVIHSTTAHTICGTNKALVSASYSGAFVTELVGGTIEVK
jgi:hypothetical protein